MLSDENEKIPSVITLGQRKIMDYLEQNIDKFEKINDISDIPKYDEVFILFKFHNAPNLICIKMSQEFPYDFIIMYYIASVDDDFKIIFNEQSDYFIKYASKKTSFKNVNHIFPSNWNLYEILIFNPVEYLRNYGPLESQDNWTHETFDLTHIINKSLQNNKHIEIHKHSDIDNLLVSFSESVRRIIDDLKIENQHLTILNETYKSRILELEDKEISQDKILTQVRELRDHYKEQVDRLSKMNSYPSYR